MIMVYDLRAMNNRGSYAAQVDGTARSARVVVPLVMRLVRDVRSVVAVGCRTGVWLASFKDAGVQRVLGLDDGAAAKQDQLEIEPEEFQAADLGRDIKLGESFDLCLCLDVADRVADRAASIIVRSVCNLADVVLFCAAIPGQGGNHHVNERWPSYWVDLFASEGYELLDVIRGRIWNDARVEWSYRQNVLLFANKSGLERVARSPAQRDGLAPMDIVHPECFEQYRRLLEASAQKVHLLEHGDSFSDWKLRAASLQPKKEISLRRLSKNVKRELRKLGRVGWLIVGRNFLTRTGERDRQPAMRAADHVEKID